MTLAYSFKSASQSILREKWINLLSTLAVASSLLLITLVSFSLYNVKVVAKRLPERFSMVLYLQENIAPEEREVLLRTLRARNDVEFVKLNSKEDALAELRKRLSNAASILEGLDENPLSESIELKLKKEFITEAKVKQIYDELKKTPGIDDVYYGEKVVKAIHLVQRSIENSSIIIFLTISFGVVFVIYTTVKILFYRRNEEIETLKLLGATRSFIRMPFLVEGGIIGLLGGTIGTISSFILYIAITYRLSAVIPILKTLVFPLEGLVILPIAGMMLGIFGATIALGRLKL